MPAELSIECKNKQREIHKLSYMELDWFIDYSKFSKLSTDGFYNLYYEKLQSSGFLLSVPLDIKLNNIYKILELYFISQDKKEQEYLMHIIKLLGFNFDSEKGLPDLYCLASLFENDKPIPYTEDSILSNNNTSFKASLKKMASFYKNK